MAVLWCTCMVQAGLPAVGVGRLRLSERVIAKIEAVRGVMVVLAWM